MTRWFNSGFLVVALTGSRWIIIFSISKRNLNDCLDNFINDALLFRENMPSHFKFKECKYWVGRRDRSLSIHGSEHASPVSESRRQLFMHANARSRPSNSNEITQSINSLLTDTQLTLPSSPTQIVRWSSNIFASGLASTMSNIASRSRVHSRLSWTPPERWDTKRAV